MNSTIITLVDKSTYMPMEHVVLIVAIAFVALALTRYIQDMEVPLALLSLVSFSIAAWYSAYISSTTALVVGGDVVYASMVSPNPTMQILLVLCTLFALVYALYLLFLRQADATLDKKSIR